jgi:hypothetical protein
MSLFQTKLHSSKQLLAHPLKKKKERKKRKIHSLPTTSSAGA